MGMLSKFRAIFAQRVSEPPQYEQTSAFAFPMRSDAQVFVTEDAALGETTAMACASLIARSIGMLPADVMVRRGSAPEDGNENLPDHPVTALLNREPNPELTGMALRERLLLSAIFHGNGFCEIERDTFGRPYRLWPIHPSRMEAERTDTGELYYTVSNGSGGRIPLPAADVLHLAGPAIDGPLGLSLISYARHAIGLSIAQRQFQSSFIANNGAPSGLVKVKGSMTPDGMKRLRAELEQIYRGPRRAGRLAIMDATTDWQQIGLSLLDAEFLAQRKFSAEQICSIFGVPPQMVGSLEKMTFANAEQASLNFLTLAVLPWTVRLEQEINRKLLSRVGDRRQPFVKFNTAAIVRADIERRTRSYAMARQWGWMSVNDIRRLEDMPPIGPDGDVYLQPMNMGPAADMPPGNQADGSPNIDQQAAALRRIK